MLPFALLAIRKVDLYINMLIYFGVVELGVWHVIKSPIYPI